MIYWLIKNLFGTQIFDFIAKSVNANDGEVSSKRMTSAWISLMSGGVIFVGIRRIYLGYDVSDNYLILVSILVGSLLLSTGIVLVEGISKILNDVKGLKNDNTTTQL